jgi:hypothetical protein
VFQGPGLHGQNTTTPYEGLFAFHQIVGKGDVGSETAYYDPSYGAFATSKSAYTSAAVGAWESVDTYRWRLGPGPAELLSTTP